MNFEFTAKFIEEFEGCRLEAYQDVAGFWTIGIGDRAHAWPGRIITRSMAEQFLESHIQNIYTCFMNLPISLPSEFLQNEKMLAALASLVYNIGIAEFEKSTMLRMIKESQPLVDIANQFHRFVFAGHKAVPALITRREKEAQLFLS